MLQTLVCQVAAWLWLSKSNECKISFSNQLPPENEEKYIFGYHLGSHYKYLKMLNDDNVSLLRFLNDKVWAIGINLQKKNLWTLCPGPYKLSCFSPGSLCEIELNVVGKHYWRGRLHRCHAKKVTLMSLLHDKTCKTKHFPLNQQSI